MYTSRTTRWCSGRMPCCCRAPGCQRENRTAFAAVQRAGALSSSRPQTQDPAGSPGLVSGVRRPFGGLQRLQPSCLRRCLCLARLTASSRSSGGWWRTSLFLVWASCATKSFPRCTAWCTSSRGPAGWASARACRCWALVRRWGRSPPDFSRTESTLERLLYYWTLPLGLPKIRLGCTLTVGNCWLGWDDWWKGGCKTKELWVGEKAFLPVIFTKQHQKPIQLRSSLAFFFCVYLFWFVFGFGLIRVFFVLFNRIS